MTFFCRMNTSSTRSLRIISLLCVLLMTFAPKLHAQEEGRATLPVVEGKVCDSQGRPLAGVVVSLESTNPGRTLVSATDTHGSFRFEAVSVGTYTVRAKVEGYQEGREGPFVLHEQEAKSIALLLTKVQTTGASKDAASAIEFSDEPHFTVAGVTDTTALGGHASGPIMRNSNTLSKETASLARENSTQPSAGSNESAQIGPTQEAAIRAMLAREDNADLHAQLAKIEEREGHPLEAVKDYQRAAEMQPTEPHLFAWGAELLLHHAPEPAIEVFTKGHRLYPQSSRMMLGLGAAWYAERSKEQAVQIFLEASDLNPSDPIPYLFLGRLQLTQQIVPPAWTDRMKRFVSLHPENAMAHYLYAVSLIKQGERRPSSFDIAEAELKTAIKLDPHLGDAYLYLGILCSEREDFAAAIVALQKAIEITPVPDEAHFRLAQVYRRMGDTEKANQEIGQFKKLSEQKDAEAERERHEIPQFVYTLREQNPSVQPSSPNPR